MAAKGKGGNTVAAVWEIAEPIAKDLGLTLWDVRFEKEGANWYLRVFIDKDGGVSIDDCVDMSHALDKPLDDADPIEQSYCLEVSSPGIERDLKRDSHFEKCMGMKIKIKLIRPLEGKREFSGILGGYENGAVQLILEDGSGFVVNKKKRHTLSLTILEEKYNGQQRIVCSTQNASKRKGHFYGRAVRGNPARTCNRS